MTFFPIQIITINIKKYIILYRKKKLISLYEKLKEMQNKAENIHGKNDAYLKIINAVEEQFDYLSRSVIKESNNIVGCLQELSLYDAIKSPVSIVGTDSVVIKETYLSQALCDFSIDVFFDHRYMIENFNKETDENSLKFYKNVEEYINFIRDLMPSYLKSELSNDSRILYSEVFENIDNFSQKFGKKNKNMVKLYIVDYFSEKTKDKMSLNLIVSRLSFLYILNKLEQEDFEPLQKKKIVGISDKEKLNLFSFLKKYNSKKYNFVIYSLRDYKEN